MSLRHYDGTLKETVDHSNTTASADMSMKRRMGKPPPRVRISAARLALEPCSRKAICVGDQSRSVRTNSCRDHAECGEHGLHDRVRASLEDLHAAITSV